MICNRVPEKKIAEVKKSSKSLKGRGNSDSSTLSDDQNMEIVQPFNFKKKFKDQGKSYDDVEEYSQIPHLEKSQQPSYHIHMKEMTWNR